jgi:sortase A
VITDTAPAETGLKGKARAPLSAIAVLGEFLILAGLILGLYVVWQLFYTDVQAGREQEKVLDSLEWAVDVPEQVDGVTAPEDLRQAIPAELQFRDIEPPLEPGVGNAETFGTFHVPRWGIDYVKPISEGVGRRDVLDVLGIGHYPESQLLGELGNFAISAHRTTYGKPFTNIQMLESGDALVVQTKTTWYVYRVTTHEIVQPEQIEVIAPVPGRPGATPTAYSITLTTCHPRYSAAQRYIVYGELDYWAPVDAGYPPELLEDVA